jgi:hypothetical protein
MDDRYCSRVHLATLDRIRATHEVIFKNPMHSDPTYCCTPCIPHIRFETQDGVKFRVLRPRKVTLIGISMNYAKADHQHPKPIAVVGGGSPVNGALKQAQNGDLMVYREGVGWVSASITPKERMVQVEMSPLKAVTAQAVCQMVNNVLHRENTLSNVDVDCKEVRVPRAAYDDLLHSNDSYVMFKTPRDAAAQLTLMGYPVREDTALADHTILIVLKG